MGLADLPVELVLRISSFLELRDLFELVNTNQDFWTVLEMEFIKRDAQKEHSQGLLWAAMCGYRSMAQKVIEAGVGVDKAFKVDPQPPKTTAMVRRLHPLAEKGTALHFAVKENRLSPIKLLLELGADPLLKNSEYRTPLELSMDPFCGPDILIKAVPEMKSYDPDPDTKIPELLAEHVKDLDRLPSVLREDGYRFLAYALRCRLVRVVRHYIHRGLDIHDHGRNDRPSSLELILEQFKMRAEWARFSTGRNRDMIWLLLTASEDPEVEFWDAYCQRLRSCLDNAYFGAYGFWPSVDNLFPGSNFLYLGSNFLDFL